EFEQGNVELFVLIHQTCERNVLIIGETRLDASRIMNHMPGGDCHALTYCQESIANKALAGNGLDFESYNGRGNGRVKVFRLQFCTNWKGGSRRCQNSASYSCVNRIPTHQTVNALR